MPFFHYKSKTTHFPNAPSNRPIFPKNICNTYHTSHCIHKYRDNQLSSLSLSKIHDKKNIQCPQTNNSNVQQQRKKYKLPVLNTQQRSEKCIRNQRKSYLCKRNYSLNSNKHSYQLNTKKGHKSLEESLIIVKEQNKFRIHSRYKPLMKRLLKLKKVFPLVQTMRNEQTYHNLKFISEPIKGILLRLLLGNRKHQEVLQRQSPATRLLCYYQKCMYTIILIQIAESTCVIQTMNILQKSLDSIISYYNHIMSIPSKVHPRNNILNLLDYIAINTNLLFRKHHQLLIQLCKDCNQKSLQQLHQYLLVVVAKYITFGCNIITELPLLATCPSPYLKKHHPTLVFDLNSITFREYCRPYAKQMLEQIGCSFYIVLYGNRMDVLPAHHQFLGLQYLTKRVGKHGQILYSLDLLRLGIDMDSITLISSNVSEQQCKMIHLEEWQGNMADQQILNIWAYFKSIKDQTTKKTQSNKQTADYDQAQCFIDPEQLQ